MLFLTARGPLRFSSTEACRPFCQARASHYKQQFRWEHYGKEKHPKDNLEGEAAPVDMVMDFSVIPVGLADDVSMAKFVGLSAKICSANHIQHDVNLMGVICEGTLDQCMDLIKEVLTASLSQAPRAVMNIKIDARPGEVNRLTKKAKKIHSILSESKDLPRQPAFTGKEE